MNVRPPLQEQAGSQGWSNFFTALFEAIGWVKSWSFRFTLDFPSIPGNSQSLGLTVPIPGARVGDSVHVTPYVDTVGLTYKGIVTTDDTVTIFGMNITTSPINPPATTYRVVVIQN